MAKYKMTEETTKLIGGTTLYRIEAVKDFQTICGMVHAGDKGGFIQEEKNLAQDGNCWVFDTAKVYFGGIVRDNACVKDNSAVSDGAIVEKSATMFNNSAAINSKVTDTATLRDRAIVICECVISDGAIIAEHAELDECKVGGFCYVGGNASMEGAVIM